jgi:hypothetical protein
MSERKLVTPDGRVWSARLRPNVRKAEIGSHVTLELVSETEIRVVSCLREEWETPEPDLAALLARSVASGASRHLTSQGPDTHA